MRLARAPAIEDDEIARLELRTVRGFDAPGEPNTTWLGLTVKAHHVTGPDTAEVEFVARYRVGGGRAVRMQERSRFLRLDGRWYYLDGDHR